MQRLLKKEKLLLGAGVSSSVIGLVSIAGIILFILKLLYLPMAICILLTAHGFYGTPLYFLRRADVKLSRRILSFVDDGVYELDAIANAVGVKSDFAEKLIRGLIKKGYLSEFELDGSTLSQNTK